MKNLCASTSLLILFVTITVFGSPLNSNKVTKTFERSSRGIKDWSIFSKTTTVAPLITTIPPKTPNNVEIGHCEENDKVGENF